MSTAARSEPCQSQKPDAPSWSPTGAAEAQALELSSAASLSKEQEAKGKTKQPECEPVVNLKMLVPQEIV